MDVINTKTETSSPSNAVDPKTVVCPTCNSPIGAKCVNGEQIVEWFHLPRVEAAIDALSTGTEPGTDTGSGTTGTNTETATEENQPSEIGQTY